MQTLTLPTHEIAYQVRGTGHPVLLLGGSGEPMLAWEMCGLVDELVGVGSQVIWFAARGVVPSGCPGLPWTVEDLADDAEALLDHLGLGTCTGIGYSLGGFTLEVLARRVQRRVDRAVLVASAGCTGTIREAFIDAENALARELGSIPPAFSRLMTLMTALGGPELTDRQTVADWWELLAHQRDQWAPPHGEAGQAQVAASWVERGSSTGTPWPNDVPAAIVCFEHDPLFPPDEAAEVAPHLGNATVELVAGTGHAGLMSRPAATIDAILRVLRATDRRVGGAPGHPATPPT